MGDDFDRLTVAAMSQAAGRSEGRRGVVASQRRAPGVAAGGMLLHSWCRAAAVTLFLSLAEPLRPPLQHAASRDSASLAAAAALDLVRLQLENESFQLAMLEFGQVRAFGIA